MFVGQYNKLETQVQRMGTAQASLATMDNLKHEVERKEVRVQELQKRVDELEVEVAEGDTVRKRAIHMSAHIEEWEAQV